MLTYSLQPNHDDDGTMDLMERDDQSASSVPQKVGKLNASPEDHEHADVIVVKLNAQ